MGFVKFLAEDFCQFEKINIKLRKRGLVWLSGQNHDTESSTSNGAGKSNVFKAILWAAYGQSIDDKDGDEVIRKGAKCATTKLWLDDGWMVERQRRKGSLKLFLHDPDGNPVEGSKDEIQERVNTLLGMDFHTARNVILYGQRDNERFIDPRTPDKDRKAILHSILRTALYSEAHEWIKKQNLDAKRKGDAVQVNIDKARARIAEHDIVELLHAESDWEIERKANVRDIKESARKLIEDATTLSKEAPDIPALEARVERLKKHQAAVKALRLEADRLRAAWVEARAEGSTALSKALEALRAFEAANEHENKIKATPDNTCPVCGSTVAGVGARHRSEAKAARIEKAKIAERLREDSDKAAAKTTAALEACGAKRLELADLEEKLAKLEDSAKLLAEARGLKDKIQALKERAREETARARRAVEAENPHTATVARARERIEAAEREIKADTDALKVLTHMRAHLEFWVRGFSPTGLPSFVLDSVMPFLTERANHYLEVLADGDITIQFTSQRELRSSKGEFRDEIGISWDIEGVEDHPPSGGQWKKMEIATEFALMDLVATREGAAPDLLMLDECLDGLDEPGRARVLTLLHQLRKTRSTIMVISHEQDMAEIFERSITVVKRDGVSTLEEA